MRCRVELLLPLLVVFLACSFLAVSAQEEYEGGGYLKGMVYGYDMYGKLVPLDWAEITVEKDGVVVTTAYSSDGVYELFVPGGDITVTVTHGGYFAQVSSLHVSDGSSTTINFYLERSEEPIPEFPSDTLQVVVGLAVLAVLLVMSRIKKRFSVSSFKRLGGRQF